MAGYIGSTPVPQATQHRETFTATNGQTSFATVGYTPQFLDVYLNGVKLAPADFTATNGSDIILASGAATNDILEVVAYTPFEVANQTFTGTTTAANLSVTGTTTAANLSVTGNATFGDNNKAIFGAGSDLTIFHDTTGTVGSYITETGSGSLNIRGNNVIFANSDGSEEYGKFFNGAGVEFNYANATKLATTATGIDVTGNATFADNGKAIFGSGNDLSIFHNGTSSLIQDSGTGGITLRSDIFTVQNAAGNETVAQFVQDGFVKLFHNNSQVFTTTSSGATITGSLGIGTSTPRTGLHLYGAGQTTSAISDAGSLGAFLRVSDTGAAGGAGGGVVFGTNASEADGFAGFAAIKGLLANGNDRTIGALAFSMRASTTDTALTERMRLTSDGKLGIGTSSPARTLEVYSSAPAIKLNNGTNAFTIGTGAFVDGSNSLVFFDEGVGERMRISSDGTLLVGKTTTASDPDTGMVLQADGIFKSTSDGSRAGHFNRGTSDGEIVRFAKDNTTVGSIGVNSGTLIVGQGASGIKFAVGANAVIPHNNISNSDTDGALDLGTISGANRRFRDLYLSGGVYLGGTVSANYLDDYEEGTWTPAFYGATSVTHDYQVGRYTKVGNLVRCEFTIGTTSLSGSQTIYINGLPFTQEVTQNQVATRGEFESIYLNYSGLSTARYGLSFTSGMLTIRQDNTGGGNSALAYSAVSNTGLFEIRGSITYRTGA
jgi:hypothetical protein